MSRLRTNDITDATATGPVDFPDGLTVRGIALSATPSVSIVATEADLDAAILAADTYIQITGSFSITSQKVMYDNVTIEVASSAYQLTGVGVTATEAMFSIPAGISGVRLIGLNCTTAQTDIDCIAIANLAVRNEVTECKLEVPALTTQSAIYIDGQLNRIVNNDADCSGSVSSPGCVFLDANSANNVVSANIVS